MQVRSLKPINLAVLAALATIVASVSSNTEAASLLNYKSNNIVESALGEANPGTTGFLNLGSNISETYSGENAEVDSLTFINKSENTNSFVYISGGSFSVSNLKTLSFLTDKILSGKAAAGIQLNDYGKVNVNTVGQVSFGSQDKRFEGDQGINVFNNSSLEFSHIDTLSFYTDANQSVNVQSTASLKIHDVGTLIFDNSLTRQKENEKVLYSALQLMVMNGDATPHTDNMVDIKVDNLIIKANSKTTYSAGISIADDTGYKGTASINGSLEAKNITIDGGSFGIRSKRSVTGSQASTLNLIATNNLAVSGGDKGIWLDNGTGSGNVLNVDTANATITGGEEGVRSVNSTASIKADSLTVSGDESALNFDKESSLTLANKTESKTANTTLNGNVTIAGNATFTNQDINQTAGTFHVGTLNASNSKLTFNTTEENGVTVDKLEGTGDLKLEAGASVTEKLGSAEKVAEELNTIIGGNAADQLKDNFIGGEASDMTGAWTYDAATGDVSYQGSRLSPTLTAVTHANAANLAQWRYEVNHLSERLGDVRSQNGALGAWARVYGTDAKVSDSVSTKFTNNTIQVGGDAKVGDSWIVGAAFAYTDNSTDFSNGSADSDGYTLSVYGTAVLPTGSYLDLIGRVGRISTDIDVSTVTPFKASYDNTAVGLSAEVGHRFDLSQIFYVTPQAELAYGRVFGDDYSGSNGMKVSQDDFDTLIARIGFQAGANFADNRGSIYLTASVNHDFLGDTEATASKAGVQDQKLKEDLGGTWFSYGIGAQFNTTNNLSFYGSLTRANGSDYQEDYHYSVGARYVF
ncbi:autotransporter outer membrane beta-barrel domain-containing protein [Sutterella wadsworthensis]|uniref:autotransporter outer membrane beta-barrel domain-containing protein n=1 Tax=Sutterella wadsworthensis TaxID=40545 RepID=UPI0013F61293|nr:autotransporter outer membrane beta-barrel domain-containing protein [Sutterella wadsworthensis]